MASIDQRLQEVKERLARACARSGRDVHSVTLLAVSKTQPAQAIREAFAAGQRAFGENYVQEALDKMQSTADLRGRIEWHLIGPLQSNKTRIVARTFDWVHSVDRLKIAQRLSEQRPIEMPPLNVCLQVNLDRESSKAGLAPDEVPKVAREVAALPRLVLRGLMSIPEPKTDFDEQRRPHRALRCALAQLVASGLAVDTLSCGMSADLEAAVFEGATLLRIGMAVFGPR